jgi:outer membrane PBP1 activator LpoA protein
MKRILSFLFAAVLLSGCALFSPDKFEPGGAYAKSETLAAMPELYATDAAFDIAWRACDIAFLYEKNNRAALWQLSPKIKKRTDEIRVEASQVWLDYAVARQAYLSNPIQANLAALQSSLARLQQLNIVALTIIQSKGEN